MAKRDKNTITVQRVDSSPTQERIAKSGGNFDIGDDKQGCRIYVFRDSTLDRLRNRKIIAKHQFDALEKYRHHWYHAGMAGKLSSIDMDRVFSSDPSGMSGMPSGERQVFHREQYRNAVACVGLRESVIVEDIVCRDGSLEDGGRRCGWRHPMQARAAAAEVLRGAGDRLAALWGFS